MQSLYFMVNHTVHGNPLYWQIPHFFTVKFPKKSEVSHLERDLRSVAAESEGPGREEGTMRSLASRCEWWFKGGLSTSDQRVLEGTSRIISHES